MADSPAPQLHGDTVARITATESTSTSIPTPSKPDAPIASFWTAWHASIAQINTAITVLPDAPAGAARDDAVAACLRAIADLGVRVNDVGGLLAGYERRACVATIKELSDKLAKTREAIAPKAKFRFGKGVSIRARHAASTSTASEGVSTHTPVTVDEKPAAAPAPPTDAVAEAANTRVREHSNCDTTVEPSFTGAQGIVLVDQTRARTRPTGGQERGMARLVRLSHCIVDLTRATHSAFPSEPESVTAQQTPAPLASLTIHTLTHSIVLAPRITGATHVTNLRHCALFLGSAQLRMHDCEDVHVHVRIGSRPIVEGCKGVRFAPLVGLLGGEEGRGGDSGETNEGEVNLWDQVDDFGWLKSEKSPNWRVLEEEERVTEEVVARVREGTGTLDEVLRAVGVVK